MAREIASISAKATWIMMLFSGMDILYAELKCGLL